MIYVVNKGNKMKIILYLFILISVVIADPETYDYMSEEHLIEHILEHPKAAKVVIFDFFPTRCTDGYFVDSLNTTEYHFDYYHTTDKLKITYTKKIKP